MPSAPRLFQRLVIRSLLVLPVATPVGNRNDFARRAGIQVPRLSRRRFAVSGLPKWKHRLAS
jgi:hypothetical protein